MITNSEEAVLAESRLGHGILRRARLEPFYWMGAVLFVGIAVLSVSSTWTILTATYDEPFHIASGMELLDKGTYTYEMQHPPLARVVVALGPYLKGLRSFSLSNATDEGNAILYSKGDSWSNLAAARSGNLIFLIQACLTVFLWGRRWFSNATGVFALLLFVSLPPILGHAGLATLDMACAATVATALYQFLRWMENPTSWRSVVLGASIALAFLCKFSSLVFLPVCFAGALGLRAVAGRGDSTAKSALGRLRVQVPLIAGVVFVLMWSGYGFSRASVSPQRGAHPSTARMFAKTPALANAANRLMEFPIPLGQVVRGIQQVYGHNGDGHESYLFGEFRMTGWWYYFPVVIAVKTPIGFLLLVGCGFFAVLQGFKSSPWQHQATVIFPVAILLVCMASRIDIGVRHILAIYPPLAVIGGHAMTGFFQWEKWNPRMIKVVPLALALWVVIECWSSRPDYIAYFNQFAGGHPERILINSDLDLGQDLHRLSQRLRDLKIDHVALAYHGTAPLEKAGLPSFTALSQDAPTRNGYVAISAFHLYLRNAKNGSFGWLKPYTPVETIGTSIYLYNFGR